VSVPTLIVEFSRDRIVEGAALDDPLSAVLDSAQLGPITTTFTEDISEFAREASTNRGAQRELERIEAGTATVVLDNRDGRFTPFDTDSPYYPDVLPMRRIRIFGAWPPIEPDEIFGLGFAYDSSVTYDSSGVPYGGTVEGGGGWGS
jgi:hypothetical protein